MDNKLKAGRIPKQVDEMEQVPIDENIVDAPAEIRPEKIFGMTPLQLFVISLEIFWLVLFVGSIILFFSGKIVFP